jgi:hypothetical protein
MAKHEGALYYGPKSKLTKYIMKNIIAFLLSGTCLTTVSYGEFLRFTNGSVGTSLTSVTLNLAGPSNLVVQIQRLNKTNDLWEAQGNLTLTNGSGIFTNSLIEGIYGFYRAKATNDSYYSTNAYGAVVGSLTNGTSMIGNIFGTLNLTNIIRNPVGGTQVYKWNNSSGIYTVYEYDSDFQSWDNPPGNFALCEGLIVKNPSVNTMRYVIDGLFDTNTITTSIPTGLSLLATPLYHITITNSWIVDTFTTNHIGGASNIPVQSSGYNPQSKIYQLWNSSGSYQTNSLSSANIWTSSGTNVTVNLKLTEGFWFDKPTNATWTVTRPIW